MSNSNFNITKVVVDPTSQEITNLEVNGKVFETGGNVEEHHNVSHLDVSSLFGPEGTEAEPVYINPRTGYDSMAQVVINSITGYPSFDPTKLSFVYEAEQPEGLELLETIQIQGAPADYHYYMVIRYDNESVGYITVQQIAGEP